MEHGLKIIQQEKVYYCDTDAYGVVWHGNYLRWLEKGRVLFIEKHNMTLSELEKQDIIMPVIEMDIKYKKSAKLEDIVTIETELVEAKRYYLTFKQVIKKDNVSYVEATVKVAAITRQGVLYRSLPEQILKLADCN